MPGLLEECRCLYDTDDLYKILNIEKIAPSSSVKRAYHKLSLKVHPDRVSQEEKDLATRKFQALGKIYSILSDTEKRKIYDETGDVDEEDNIQQDRNWEEYWRLLFHKITFKDIQEFEEKYKGSEEELDDLKSAYMDFRGDMDEILQNVMCATIDDEERFSNILHDLIKQKALPKYKAFTHEKSAKKTQRRKEAMAEAAEAEELKEELGMGDMNDLKSMIMKKQSSREKDADSFFAHLEAKYAQPAKKSKKKAK